VAWVSVAVAAAPFGEGAAGQVLCLKERMWQLGVGAQLVRAGADA